MYTIRLLRDTWNAPLQGSRCPVNSAGLQTRELDTCWVPLGTQRVAKSLADRSVVDVGQLAPVWETVLVTAYPLNGLSFQ